MSEENVALRDINVKFQLDNFKLQQKIKHLESSIESGNVSDDAPECLEEDFSFNTPAKKEKKPIVRLAPGLTPRGRPSRTAAASKSYLEYAMIEDENEDLVEQPNGDDDSKVDIKQEFVITDSRTEKDFNPNDIDIDLEDEEEIDPKEAVTQIFKLAAKAGTLDKIKCLEPGKQKDSYFIHKVLDLMFDRMTLANSSARGQKSHSKPIFPVRPALDRKKMHLIRQAFLYRLKREGLSVPARNERMKFFNIFVNLKIQNSRKLFRKSNQME